MRTRLLTLKKPNVHKIIRAAERIFRINDMYGGSETRIISEYAPPRAEPITRRNVLTLRFASLEVILRRRKVIKKFIMKRTST